MGFEPTHLTIVQLECTPLDHSGIKAYSWDAGRNRSTQTVNTILFYKKLSYYSVINAITPLNQPWNIQKMKKRKNPSVRKSKSGTSSFENWGIKPREPYRVFVIITAFFHFFVSSFRSFGGRTLARSSLALRIFFAFFSFCFVPAGVRFSHFTPKEHTIAETHKRRTHTQTHKRNESENLAHRASTLCQHFL